MRKPFRLAAGLLLALHAAFAPAQNAYPDKPVRIIVPFSAGGGGDVNGRLIANKLTERFKQSFVVDNRAGAGGNIGTVALKQAAPDGYTLLLVTAATVINPTLYARAGYDARRDLAPVAAWSRSPLLILVNPNVPAKNLREFVAYAKAHPGKLSFASGGMGIITHMEMEALKQQAGIDLLHIPFPGQAPAVVAVAGGQVDAISDSVASSMALLSAGKLKALATTSHEPLPGAPDIPTVASQGYPQLEASAWYGLVAPAGTPTRIVQALSAALHDILAQPETQRQLAAVGAEPFQLDHQAFAGFMDREGKLWAEVIRRSALRVD